MNNKKSEIVKNNLSKYYFNSSSGITLVALVITIIVLLILAGVSISLVVGENGILAQATTAVEKNEIAQEKEQIHISYAGEKTDVFVGKKQVVTAGDLETAMNNTYGEGTVTIREEEGALIVKYTKSEREYTISNDGKVLAVEENDSEIEEGEDVKIIQPTDVTQWIWSLDEATNTIKITGYKGPDREVVIPNYIGEKPVTNLGVGYYEETPFYSDGGSIWNPGICESYGLGCGGLGYMQTYITKVTISEGITHINPYAFRMSTAINEIVIPKSMTSIGDRAFDYCTNLTTVNYCGTEEDWSNITIGSGNTYLNNATINYNYSN